MLCRHLRPVCLQDKYQVRQLQIQELIFAASVTTHTSPLSAQVLRDLDRSCSVSFLRRNTTGDSTLLLGSPDFTPLSEDSDHCFGSSSRSSHMKPFPRTTAPGPTNPQQLASASVYQSDQTMSEQATKQADFCVSGMVGTGNGFPHQNVAIASCAASGGIPMYSRHNFGPSSSSGGGIQQTLPSFSLPNNVQASAAAADQSAPFLCKAQYFLI